MNGHRNNHVTNHNDDESCGILPICRPRWLQRFANARCFLVVYCLLGIIQSMSFMYFTITLTTLERRFKMPSGTTGWVLSGNEISQILLSLVLSYAGGTRHRPRWIAGGAVMSALSCFILAMPHFIFGAGDEALQLTREYVEGKTALLVAQNVTSSVVSSSSAIIPQVHSLCRSTAVAHNESIISSFDCTANVVNAESDIEPYSIVPLILIFASQFVLGIGTTMFYTLGTSYLDDGVPKSDTPMTLAYACTFRIFGMVLGFGLIHVALHMYIDPWRTPLIDEHDPRWMGAWWFGWLLLGSGMLLAALLMGLFPKVMPMTKKKVTRRRRSAASIIMPQQCKSENGGYVTVPMQEKTTTIGTLRKPFHEDDGTDDNTDTFAAALLRLLRNKLLMYNNIANIFYIMGSTVSFTYIAKYMEVQFQRDSANASKITGPLTILSMMTGFLLSGWLITRHRPAPRKLFMWNLVVGVFGLAGLASNLWLQCTPESVIGSVSALQHVRTDCNRGCGCDTVPYSPVCDERTGRTYYSPCHAGCEEWSDAEMVYERCGCLLDVPVSVAMLEEDEDADFEYVNDFSEEDVERNATTTTTTSSTTATRTKRQSNTAETEAPLYRLIPGACAAGCASAFVIYTIISCVINWLGASARIGNILLSFRAVSVRDKSFAQGFGMWSISLLALIPGPIIFGYIIDSTCLEWKTTAKTTNNNHSSCASASNKIDDVVSAERGNCQLYDQELFRWSTNMVSMCFTTIGIMFDWLVWYYGQEVDLYGDRDEEVVVVDSVCDETEQTKKVTRK